MKTMTHHNYQITLVPDVHVLRAARSLLVGGEIVEDFLGAPRDSIDQLIGTDRIPLPVRLGLGTARRWSVLELLEWVEANCPHRTVWLNQRGWSGWRRLDQRHHR